MTSGISFLVIFKESINNKNMSSDIDNKGSSSHIKDIYKEKRENPKFPNADIDNGSNKDNISYYMSCVFSP